MASSFNTSVAALEDELMTLILDGKIQARIDSHNKVIYRVYQQVFLRRSPFWGKIFNRILIFFSLNRRKIDLRALLSKKILTFFQVLFAQDTDQRSVTFEKAIEMAHLYEERARIMILRSAILKSKVSFFFKSLQQEKKITLP